MHIFLPAFARLGGFHHAEAELLRGKGGGGRIRTSGTLRHAAFQVRCDRPLCHPSLVCYATAMRYLGIDYGTKRIGVAVSDAEGRIAFPLTVVDAGIGALSAVDTI